METIGWIAFWAFIAAIILVPQVLKSRDRQKLYETMRAAYDKGQPLPPELMDVATRRGRDLEAADALVRNAALVPPEPAGVRDLRRAVVWLAVGVGLVLVGAAFYAGLYNDGGAAETFATFAAFGAVPLCVGLAFLGLWFFTRKTARAADAPRTPRI